LKTTKTIKDKSANTDKKDKVLLVASSRDSAIHLSNKKNWFVDFVKNTNHNVADATEN